MMMERLDSPGGPTQGKILRPGDNKEPESFAFVQCAGSRDENHLEFCSYICCMASLKQATYIREQYPDANVYIFYIDVRAPGQRYAKFYQKIKEEEIQLSEDKKLKKSHKNELKELKEVEEKSEEIKSHIKELKALIDEEDEKIQAEKKHLKRAKKTKYVQRSAIMKIIAAWIINVPAAAIIAAIVFNIIKSIMN